jgi:DHA1 family bicyclomycin/chloramphenicol resistance-like MFS transporter
MSGTKTSIIGALLVALGPISMALYTPAMPALVRVFDTDVSAVKLTLTVYFLGFAVAQLVCGPLSDTRGRRPVVLWFTGLYLAGSLIAVFAPSIEWLLAARLVQGVGAAAGIAIARAIVRDLFVGRQSAQVMNMIALMLMVAPAIAPTLGGLTLEFLGWREIFVLMALYGVAVIAIFYVTVPETLPPSAANEPRKRLVSSYATLIRDARFLRPALSMACMLGAYYALATVLPFVLIEGAGLTPVEFGFAMLSHTVAFMFGALMMRRLLKSIDAHRLVPVALWLISVAVVLMVFAVTTYGPGLLTVMGPTALFSLGLPFAMPSMTTASLAPFPHIAGAASALAGFLQMAIGLVGSAVAALMGDANLALLTVLPVLLLASVVIHVALRGATSRMEEAVADRIIHPHEVAAE